MVTGERVIEHGGYLWKPKSGATASAEEFVAARTLIVGVHEEARWSPWVMDDRSAEYGAASEVFGQWTRAEPGFRQLTPAEVEAWSAEEDARFEERRAADEAERLARVDRYDEQRAKSRLTLLQLEAMLRGHEAERARLSEQSSAKNSEPDPDLAEVDALIEVISDSIDGERNAVNDPESVIDSNGRLPADRRKDRLVDFKLWRESEVRRLRTLIGESEVALRGTAPRSIDRARLREDTKLAVDRLEWIAAIPPLMADAMCSECAWPIEWHHPGVRGLEEIRRCPIRPGWAAIPQTKRSRPSVGTGSPDKSAPRRSRRQKPILLMPPEFVLPSPEEAKRIATRLSSVASWAANRASTVEPTETAEATSTKPSRAANARQGRSSRRAHTSVSALQQPPVPVDREAWTAAFGELVPPLGADVISRAEVFAVAGSWRCDTASSLTLLIATCMWRFGTAGNGVSRVAKMIDDRTAAEGHLQDALSRIAAGSEMELRDAYRSFKHRNHLPQLGPAIWTSLLYYAGYRRGVGGIQPLILDSRIAQHFNRQVKDVKDHIPTSMPTDDQWLAWLRWAADRAGSDGEPEDCEYRMSESDGLPNP